MTSDNMSLCEEEKKILHSIFANTLQNDRGKKHVRKHDQDLNVQLVCSKLESFCTKFTRYRVTASDILSCMTSAKIESWKGTSE